MPRRSRNPGDRLMTAGEADAYYRLRKGTAYQACIARELPSAERRGRGRSTYLIEKRDADRLWGVG